jgi:hypothetical protein
MARHRTPAAFVLALGCFLLGTGMARGDGGTVRLSESRGGYRITVFTSPNPFRAGPVDVSVLVQDAATGEPAPDVGATVRATPHGRPEAGVRQTATTEAATNKLFRAALFELPEPGWWELQVAVDGPRGAVEVRFEVEAAEPLPQWPALWAWIGWPAVAVLLFAIHQVLVKRKTGNGAGVVCGPRRSANGG